MTTDGDLEIKEAFQRAQKGHTNRAELVASLKARYSKLEDKTVFHQEFIHYLKYAMIVYEREPAVEHVIGFVSMFATSFQSPPKEGGEEEEGDDDDEEEEEHPFLSYMFTFLLESHKADSRAVRFRVCQLIKKLLGSMAANAVIDDDLFDSIIQAMLVRVTDKFPNIRIQAVLAMTRLQEPQNPDCPTIKAYMLILENDSNAEVRRAVLSSITPIPLTLPKILTRTRDVKENVRKLAYEVLAEKVPVKALHIAQRVSLLQEGLHDSSEPVREVVRSCLLPAWLRLLQGDVLDLLHMLDVENCSQTALDTLSALLSSSPPQGALQDAIGLGDRRLIPVESLSCERVLCWRALCEHVKAQGDQGEELLERLLPDAATYADYLSGYLKGVPVMSEEQRADFTQLEMVMKKEFISQQLIHLTGCLDTNEEGGRRCVLAVLQEMLRLPETPPSLVSLLTQKLLSLFPDDTRRTQAVAAIISDVREPIVAVSQPVGENELRRRQVKLAEAKVRIIEAKMGLEESVAAQDFSAAAQLKETVRGLEEHWAALLLEAQESCQTDKDTRVEKTDPDTMLRCLTMCLELLKQMNMKTRMGPTMTAITSSLILPSIENAQPNVRNMAVLCLGTCALHSKELATTHLVLLLQIAQLDENRVRVSALRAVMDLLLRYSFQLLADRPAPRPGSSSHWLDGQEEELAPANEKAAEEEGNIALQSTLIMFSDFLDSEVSDLCTETAEGLAKLMFNGRICSSKLLSRLVLLWYNPVTEDDTRLRHRLGTFFQLYARENRVNQECIEECFLPTLRTLLNAPATSPLAEVDVTNVAELLIVLTRPSMLLKPSNTEGMSVHDRMAVRVCGEMLNDPTAPEVRLYAKTLISLELSRDQGTREDLLSRLHQVTQEVKDRVCLRAIEKLIGQLQDFKTDLSATALQALDINADGVGQKKTTTARSARKPSRTAESSEESDGENVPDSAPAARPSRRAKMTALEKTRLDLSALINQHLLGKGHRS